MPSLLGIYTSANYSTKHLHILPEDISHCGAHRFGHIVQMMFFTQRLHQWHYMDVVVSRHCGEEAVTKM